MHGLNLPQRDKINLLIGGIEWASLRAIALTLGEKSVEIFLEKNVLCNRGYVGDEKENITNCPITRETRSQSGIGTGGVG